MRSLANLGGKTALVTGGTRGIGLETALLLASSGARCILTYRWGDHSEEELASRFSAVGGQAPLLIQADAADGEDTAQLVRRIKDDGVSGIDIFVSNVSAAMLVQSLGDYTLKGLKQSLRCSSWPLVEYLRQMHAAFGRHPRHVVAVSSTGPDHYSIGYDYVAASKIVLESFVRDLDRHLSDQGVIVNAVRSRAIRTQLFEDTFGKEFTAFAERIVPDAELYWITPEEVAGPIAALCSGACDSIRGQVLTVDKGTGFFDNIMQLYSHHLKTNLEGTHA